MAFHPDKCQVLQITRKRNIIRAGYFLHGQKLEVVSASKYLGITITKDLKWKHHCDNVSTKASRMLGFLKRNLNISSIKLKTKAYTSLVRPLVEYACPVWDPYHQDNIRKIEMIQRRACRYVTN